jgi:hypothetical protein
MIIIDPDKGLIVLYAAGIIRILRTSWTINSGYKGTSPFIMGFSAS